MSPRALSAEAGFPSWIYREGIEPLKGGASGTVLRHPLAEDCALQPLPLSAFALALEVTTPKAQSNEDSLIDRSREADSKSRIQIKPDPGELSQQVEGNTRTQLTARGGGAQRGCVTVPHSLLSKIEENISVCRSLSFIEGLL